MRLRNETLRTGRLLACFHPGDRTTNRSLLVMVEGAADIAPLTGFEIACKALIEERRFQGFEWHTVPDQAELTVVDPLLDASKVTRLEAAEVADLDDGDLRAILGPALARLARFEPEVFPTAAGAVGGIARGVQFLDREADLERLASGLRVGERFYLLAPRRSGKSSLLQRLAEDLAGDRTVLFLDLERDASPEDLAARVWSQATETSIRTARQHVEQDGWTETLTAALERLAQAAGRPLVLLLDELVYLLQNLRRGSDDAGHRAASVAVLDGLADIVDRLGTAVVVASSIDLPTYLSEDLGLPDAELPRLVCELTVHALPSLASGLLPVELRRVLLGTGLVLEAGDAEWLEEHLDLALPWISLRFLDELASRVRVAGRLATADLMAELARFLAETDAFKEIEVQVREKGQSVQGAREAATEALDRLAEASFDEGVLRRVIIDVLDRRASGRGEELLTWLVDTLPIRAEGDRLALSSRLFRRWWQEQM